MPQLVRSVAPWPLRQLRGGIADSSLRAAWLTGKRSAGLTLLHAGNRILTSAMAPTAAGPQHRLLSLLANRTAGPPTLAVKLLV